MTETDAGQALLPTATQAREWLTDKIATRLQVTPADVDADKYFDEFGLDSIEALMLSAELESWLGWELEPTALWYHPTIRQLAEYIAEFARQRLAGGTPAGPAEG